VEVFDVVLGPDGKSFAIIEEHLSGSDLSTLKLDPKNPVGLLKVVYQIAKGLEDIHGKDIVHRDIKPNNIKFDAENYVKIFDFGLAKGPPLPGTTLTLTGTAGFMAPELFVNPANIDKPVDVYAFGAMMFQFVTGSLPPCAQPWPTPPVQLTAVQSIGALGLSSPRLGPLIDKCLDLDPSKRPTITQIRATIAKELLYGRHKATLTTSASSIVLGKVGDKAKATHGPHVVEVEYNGYEFVISAISGSVSVNNRPATLGMSLDGAHVLTLGAIGVRLFVTFDVSHPEVAL
jgi:serine/threonine-protein kinase